MREMIWYCDHKNDNPFELHSYLQQFITNNTDNIDHFTVQPSIDSTILSEFESKIIIKTFPDYKDNSNGVVVIGLHGGWDNIKLELITKWFTSDHNRQRAWRDESCRIVLDYSMEGFGEEAFGDLYNWSREHGLEDRLVYVSGDLNIQDNYRLWCAQHRVRPAMTVSYYGYFAVWASRQLQATQQTARRRRYMSLNRRPHYHRIMMMTILERRGLIEHGTISMPRDFEEPDIGWAKDQWDLRRLWDELKELQVGFLDRYESAFQSLHNKLPLIADRTDFETNHALDFNTDLYSEHPVNLITETLCFTNSAFASEKIWKPMAAGQIFLVLSGPYYLRGLKRIGFRTFAPYINEEYDEETEPIARANLVARELKRLISISDEEFDAILTQCQAVIKHNQQLVTDQIKMKATVARELVKTLEGKRGTN
jgi:hypothetical protein